MVVAVVLAAGVIVIDGVTVTLATAFKGIVTAYVVVRTDARDVRPSLVVQNS